jgi:hypothetical protein
MSPAPTSIPVPAPTTLALLILALLVGMTVPFYLALERIRGVGRALLAKLPYEPPPGMDREQALVRARRRVEGDILEAADEAEEEMETRSP